MLHVGLGLLEESPIARVLLLRMAQQRLCINVFLTIGACALRTSHESSSMQPAMRKTHGCRARHASPSGNQPAYLAAAALQAG